MTTARKKKRERKGAWGNRIHLVITFPGALPFPPLHQRVTHLDDRRDLRLRAYFHPSGFAYHGVVSFFYTTVTPPGFFYLLLFRIINAAITPGIQPARVRIKTIKTEPHPKSIIASGGKMMARITRRQDMLKYSFF